VKTVTPAALIAELEARAQVLDRRLMVAIVGAPGSGKSTLAEALYAEMPKRSVIVPMDGFHLDNATLEARGRLAKKGAADTFDAAGFVALIQSVARGEADSFPTFDRENDCTVRGGGAVPARADIALCEGNYLLLNAAPWAELQALWDVTVWIDVPMAELRRRLVARWQDHGLSAADAVARAEGNDLANAAYVAEHSAAADFAIRPD